MRGGETMKKLSIDIRKLEKIETTISRGCGNQC
jgi:hypothetical protein